MHEIERVGRAVVRSFYDPEPSNDSDAQIWCLGRAYASRQKPSPKPTTTDTSSAADTPAAASSTSTSTPKTERPPGVEDDSWIRTSIDESERKDAPNGEGVVKDRGWPTPFLDDFETRIWMTYRSGFSPIQKSQDPKATEGMSWQVRMRMMAQSTFTSDAGFGCMIRSGQCILANALQYLTLGRDWRLQDATDEKNENDLLQLFADDYAAPFSVHRFIEHGVKCDKYPGQWFGPSAAAQCIQALAHAHKAAGLRVYLTGDGATVYEDEFRKAATDADDKFQPTLILVGTRLGIDKINPVYHEAVKAALQMRQSVGIAGGRTAASHYFVGHQDSSFFYLDPHSTRPLLPYHAEPTSYTADEIATCHTRRLRRIDIKDMDPSMLVAFLIKSEEDLHEWKKEISSVQGKAIVHISEKEPPPRGVEREEAVDEVESFDEREDEEGEVI